LLPTGSAIDLRGLEERFVNRLQAAERDNHHEREPEPDIRQNARRERLERRFEPFDRCHREILCDYQVNRAVLVIEHPAPCQRGDILRHRPRDNQQRAENALAGERAVEEHRQKHAYRDMEKDVDNSPDDRFRENRVEEFLAEHLGVLAESDDFPVGEVAHGHIRE